MSVPRARITAATTADVDTVAWIHHVARTAYYAGSRTAHATGRPSREIRNFWAAFIAEPVGFVAYGPATPPARADALNLRAMYVLPHFWSRGTGSRLHGVFLEALRASGRAAGVLEVWDGNTRAREFYARHGWRSDGLSRPGPRHTAYLGMELLLG